ncbi:MAG TPA: alkaline phosphatase family protein, partial [Xanthobacteraceae bacterium]|nr:alkaline phosphatase family protein [Xanthobacteraceae bacterium]
MELMSCRAALAAAVALFLLPATYSALADDDRNERALQNVKHIIVVMQENHSFDNYFGVLAYVPGGVYHPVRGGRDGDDDHGDRDSGRDGDDRDAATGCHPDDHRCVDGLACGVAQNGTLSCSNANIVSDGTQVFAFHNTNRCVNPDLDHGWFGTHREANFARPNASLK